MQRSYGQKTVSPTLRCLFGVLKPFKNTLYEVLEVLLEVLEVVLEVLEVVLEVLEVLLEILASLAWLAGLAWQAGKPRRPCFRCVLIP